MKNINLADTIIMFVGFYFLISNAMMKVHGRVNRMLVSKKYDISRAKDLPGFIQTMYIPNIVIGAVTMTAGAAHYILNDILGYTKAATIVYIVYLILFIIYAVLLAGAQKKHLSPQ